MEEGSSVGAWDLQTDRMLSEARIVWVDFAIEAAAVSVPANIAEGFKRQGKGDKTRFYNIAQASLGECRYYLILSQDLNYAETAELADKLDEVSRMLDSYIAAIAVSKSK